MKKSWSSYLHIAFEILDTCLPGAGMLLLLDGYFGISWSPAGILVLVLLFQMLLFWSEEKKLRIQFWAVVFLSHAAAGLLLMRFGEITENYLLFVGLEASCAAVCVFCYLARQRFWMKVPLLVLLFAGMIYFGINEITLEKWEVCLLLLCFLLFLAEAAESKKLQVPVNKKCSTRYLFPMFLASVLLLFALPVKPTPIQWELLKSAAKTVSDTVVAAINGIEHLLTGEDSTYSMSFMGYDPDGKLGGGVFSGDSPQISVEGTGTESPLYLLGTMFTEYTGAGWEIRSEDKPYEEKEYWISYEELTAALAESIYSPEEIRGMIKQRSLRISYEGLRTESLFRAPATSRIVLPGGMAFSEKQGDNLILSKVKSAGFSYEISFMEVDYANEKIEQLLRQQAFVEMPKEDAQQAQRSAFIHEMATGLPETLPKRVWELADQITEGAQTDYDRLKAIEAYLNGYTYTKTPQEVPEGWDFTDYFLFESKSGYCTYFATAMAVLARCEGIPTRYVEGFVTGETRSQKNTVIELTGQNAHAWVEAYIDHIGWIPFEPTPGYQEAVYTAWEQPKESEVHLGDAPQPVENTENTELYEVSGTEGGGNYGKILLAGLKAVLVVCAMTAIIFCLAAARRFLHRRAYKKKDAYGKILCLMERILSVGALSVSAIAQGETLSSYRERIGKRLDTEEESFSGICELYQSIRFGGNTVEKESIGRLESYVGSLEQEYLMECGWPKKIWYYLIR